MASVMGEVVGEKREHQQSVYRLFEDTRKRLVETGTRNRLVHVNRQNTRGSVVNVINERSDDVYSILSNGKAMRFLAIGRDKDTEHDTVRLADSGEPGFDPERYTDAQLETRMGPDALQKRLLKMAREAQTAEEESGVNVLYLALGFLSWIESKASSIQREAPLVLLPVQLTRNQRTSTYDIRLRDEDIVTNLPLQQRLKDDFGLLLPELEVDDEWTPSSYFAEVELAIASHSTWKVDQDGMQVGFFSFSKLLMYRDLLPAAWPENAIVEHGLIRGLLYEGFEPQVPFISVDDRLDEVLQPEQIFHVVDADASQTIAIEEVRKGRNLVVQGPPGTGKSQTITNIIAAAAREGKRVLFVAEKMAALSVVHDRLVKVGLADICLELHSRTANKKEVLAELARTIAKAAAVPSMSAPPVALTEARDTLNRTTSQMHQVIGVTEETPFSVLALQSRYIGLGISAPRISGERLANLNCEQMLRLSKAMEEFGAALEKQGKPESHPFWGVRNLDLQPVEISRLSDLLIEAKDRIGSLRDALKAAVEALGIEVSLTRKICQPVMETLAGLQGLPQKSTGIANSLFAEQDFRRLCQALEAGVAWRSAVDAAHQTFVPGAFEISPITLRGALAAGTQSFFSRWGSAYRTASRELAGMLRAQLPKRATERLALLDQLILISSLKAKWKIDEAYCAKSLGETWRSDLTDFSHLLSVARWCEKVRNLPISCSSTTALSLGTDTVQAMALHKKIADSIPEAAKNIEAVMAALDVSPLVLGSQDALSHDIPKLLQWLDLISLSVDRYFGWVELQRLQKEVSDAGVSEIADKMGHGELSSEAAIVEVRYARAEFLWKSARQRSPELQDLQQRNRHQWVERFASLERERLKENVTDIVAKHLAQVPQGAMGEMKVIRGEIGKKRGHIALRKLISTAGNALQRIKPVMLMSPISVAQYVPPGSLDFDLLVIDEASQVRPEDALGVIARANQIVVVGDQKQLPPSSFFDRLLSDEGDNSDDDEAEEGLLGGAAKVGEMESILSLCEARGLNSRMLKGHYRSRDPSLIQVSNREFYNGQLILPPSPLQNDPDFGLCFTRVEGVYDKGGKRDNRLEGEAIVKRVAEHARQSPERSLGIVTFSSSQRNLITELLEMHRRADSVLDDFLREGKSEEVFVKNIENVQGDERDVILVSVCYGPTEIGGRLSSMSFGPVNAEGGERRLNVLFTRARLKCEVFASFDPGDIDPSRSARSGVRIFKHYLDFASGAALSDAHPSGLSCETPFEQDVADVIKSIGYLADPQVGSAGFRIDLGIRHPDRPGTYIMAVECDGATYHSALWARERDRLRQDILEHLGWRFYRIWSTDWFYNRKAEIERLRMALDKARESAGAANSVPGANKILRKLPSEVKSESISFQIPDVKAMQMPLYRRFFSPMGNKEPHELPTSTLSDLVIRIVREEGPIHFEETARRLAFCFGKEKAGTRIVTATTAALNLAQTKDVNLLSDGTFWFMREHLDITPVRDRSNEVGATAKAANISMLEIKAALNLVHRENAGGTDDEIIRSAARLLGFKRVGADLQERLAAGLGSA